MPSLSELREAIDNAVTQITQKPARFYFVEKASDSVPAMILVPAGKSLVQADLVFMKRSATGAILEGTCEKADGKLRFLVSKGAITSGAQVALKALMKARGLEGKLATTPLVEAHEAPPTGGLDDEALESARLLAALQEKLEDWGREVKVFVSDCEKAEKRCELAHAQSPDKKLSAVRGAVKALKGLKNSVPTDAIDEKALLAAKKKLKAAEVLIDEAEDIHEQIKGLNLVQVKAELGEPDNLAAEPWKELTQELAKDDADGEVVSRLISRLDDVSELRKRSGRARASLLWLSEQFDAIRSVPPSQHAWEQANNTITNIGNLQGKIENRTLELDLLGKVEAFIHSSKVKLKKLEPKSTVQTDEGVVFEPVVFTKNAYRQAMQNAGDTDQALRDLATGQLNDRHPKVEIYNKPLHQHAAGGKEGFAFCYRMREEGGRQIVTPTVYNYAPVRTGNRYHWDGVGQSSAPPKLPRFDG